MNRKRKVLTVIGLVVFGVVMWGHIANNEQLRLTTLLSLGVFYAGFYALLGEQSKPHNWRRIIKWTGIIVTILVLIAGSIGAVLYAKNAQQEAARRQARIESTKREQAEKIEKEKREQAEKQAKQMEVEASRNRIKASEIDLIDLQLKVSGSSKKGSFGIFDDLVPATPDHSLHGRIRNRSTHTLNSITLRVQFYEKDGSPDILGDKTVRIQVNVPAHQTREISWPISFEGAPQLTEYAWKYAITEIRGGQKWVDNFLDE